MGDLHGETRAKDKGFLVEDEQFVTGDSPVPRLNQRVPLLHCHTTLGNPTAQYNFNCGFN